jgi:hypothetical protein
VFIIIIIIIIITSYVIRRLTKHYKVTITTMMCSKVLEGELYLAISTVLFAIEIVASRKATNNIAGPSTFKAWTRILSTVILYILKRPLQSALDSNIGDNKEPEHIEVLARVKKQLPFINEYTFDLYFWGAISGLSNVGVSLCFQTGLLTVQGML